MMAQSITVNQLAAQLNSLIKQGKGDYQIFLTDDEECNGYHACWYLGTEGSEVEDAEEYNHDYCILGDHPEKALYIG